MREKIREKVSDLMGTWKVKRDLAHNRIKELEAQRKKFMDDNLTEDIGWTPYDVELSLQTGIYNSYRDAREQAKKLLDEIKLQGMETVRETF